MSHTAPGFVWTLIDPLPPRRTDVVRAVTATLSGFAEVAGLLAAG
jgi:hypothetical protein